MKTFVKNVYRSILTIALAGMAITTNVAASHNEPGEKGYWVVETNANTKDFSVIKFYNQAHELVYEENLEGLYLDIRRKKNVKMLNRTLQVVTNNAPVSGQTKEYSKLVAESVAKRK